MDVKCRAFMTQVDALRNDGKYDEAKATCDKVIADYPGSEWARKAAEALEIIKKEATAGAAGGATTAP